MEVKAKLTNLLCELVEDDELRSKYDCDGLTHFIKALPRQLLEPVVPFQVVKAISLLCRQRCRAFLNSFNEVALDIVNNLGKITILSNLSKVETNIAVASLFYWIDDKKLLLNISATAKNLDLDQWNADLIVEIIERKLQVLSKE